METSQAIREDDRLFCLNEYSRMQLSFAKWWADNPELHERQSREDAWLEYRLTWMFVTREIMGRGPMNWREEVELL